MAEMYIILGFRKGQPYGWGHGGNPYIATLPMETTYDEAERICDNLIEIENPEGDNYDFKVFTDA